MCDNICLGGCGKSKLAIEFAYRALSHRTGRLVFWVPAISQESFELASREIGVRLGVAGITEDNADIKKLVKDALESKHLATNADTKVARLVDYLPKGERGKIVFITRSRKAAADLTQSNKLELKHMSKVEARKLLSRKITNEALLGDIKIVDELLELLVYLPLAIVQAGALIDNNDMVVSKYVSLIRNVGNQAELFGERFEDPSRYQEIDSTIAKTWHISFDRI